MKKYYVVGPTIETPLDFNVWAEAREEQKRLNKTYKGHQALYNRNFVAKPCAQRRETSYAARRQAEALAAVGGPLQPVCLKTCAICCREFPVYEQKSLTTGTCTCPTWFFADDSCAKIQRWIRARESSIEGRKMLGFSGPHPAERSVFCFRVPPGEVFARSCKKYDQTQGYGCYLRDGGCWE